MFGYVPSHLASSFRRLSSVRRLALCCCLALAALLLSTDSGWSSSACGDADERAGTNCAGTTNWTAASEYATSIDALHEPEIILAQSETSATILEILDAPYVALKNANVRSHPNINSPRVATLPKGSEVTVLGKVKNRQWYLVARDGKTLGYVFSSLMVEAGKEAIVEAKTSTEVKEDISLPTVFRNPDAVAVIIGNRNYEGGIPSVDYAHNDATAIKRYATELLGYDPDNIIDLRDATKAQIEAVFGNERTHQGKLWSYLAAKGASDVVVYYSGHGVPGQSDQKGYILPTNADPNQPEINGYPLELLYANLDKLDTHSVTVLLDACFSGSSHGGILIRSASPVYVSATDMHDGSGEVVVLAAASGDQLASWDEKAMQGLFTRYFLEAVYGAADANDNRRIDLEEIKSYLDERMTRRARRDFLREQEAWVSGSPDTILVHLGAAD